MTDPLIGRKIGERFRITSRIGEGGMGVVYLADDLAAQGRAAVKFLHRHLMQNGEFLARFQQEAKSASRFRHESAVRILASGDGEDGIPYIAMEYCPGRSLKSVLREDGPLPVRRAASIGVQILRAVAEAHKHGIIHRDLKPENIKVETTSDGGDRVKILDFGVAKFVGGEDGAEMTGAVKTKTGIVFGTPKYMAPEQILGEPVDSRSDVYSVGAILYEMLAGSSPFASDDVMGFVTKHLKEPVEPIHVRAPERMVPPEFEKIVLEMLEKNRVMRPARAGELADQIQPFVEMPEKAAPKPISASARRFGPLFYLAGGLGGAAAAFVLARDYAVEAGAAAVGLGAGATAAFMLFPRVGETAFWLRTLLVAGAVGVAGAAVWLAAGRSGHLTAAFGLTALLAFVLYSAGWGRRARIAAVLLGGLLAPALAAAFLPVPAGKGYASIWESSDPKGILLAAVAIAGAFAAAGLLAPPALPAAGGGSAAGAPRESGVNV